MSLIPFPETFLSNTILIQVILDDWQWDHIGTRLPESWTEMNGFVPRSI